MCAQQYFHIVQSGHLAVGYGHQAFATQAFHLVAVMYNVAQTVQCAGFGQLLLGLAYGSDHTEAEA